MFINFNNPGTSHDLTEMREPDRILNQKCLKCNKNWTRSVLNSMLFIIKHKYLYIHIVGHEILHSHLMFNEFNNPENSHNLTDMSEPEIDEACRSSRRMQKLTSITVAFLNGSFQHVAHKIKFLRFNTRLAIGPENIVYMIKKKLSARVQLLPKYREGLFQLHVF